MSRLLLATDLDGTLLPNGAAAESPGARERFARLAAHPDVTLVYVTGRDPGLVDEAIATWQVPLPDVLIADVGATIADRVASAWKRWPAWDETIAPDWGGRDAADLAVLLRDVPGLADLHLQDASRQARWKLSFEAPPDAALPRLAELIRDRLRAAGVRASVIFSRDEVLGVGLMDVLPAAADKGRALAFVMARLGFGPDETVFAGDSGNDLEVLAGPVPAVLVANADPELRTTAHREAAAAGHGPLLYLARGNYAAGILEGVLHYHPAWAARLEETP
ncbi:MAG: HAD-IIB family hydrolase [Krumholzibacteria bacterium]|nr:HAD-IIB family hydrolase [Candidatus Krumholzibacteria bacterium]